MNLYASKPKANHAKLSISNYDLSQWTIYGTKKKTTNFNLLSIYNTIDQNDFIAGGLDYDI